MHSVCTQLRESGASQKRIRFKAKLDENDGPNAGVIGHGLLLKELDALRDPLVGKSSGKSWLLFV